MKKREPILKIIFCILYLERVVPDTVYSSYGFLSFFIPNV